MSKILLVEDDEFISKAYNAGFTKEGYELVLASDGEEGFAKAKDSKPDLILLDLIVPKKNGFELLAELKGNDSLKSIPVIVLSNLGQDSDIEKAKKMGAADYLVKSNISMEEVLSKIEGVLGKK